MKKCLPICTEELALIEQVLERHAQQFDAFEIWLDYIAPLNLSEIQRVAARCSKELILLFRRKELEPTKTPPDIRGEFIDALQGENILWDFDITGTEELNFFRSKERKSKLICSYHNYSKTPATEELYRLLRSMKEYSPEIYKFACLCEERGDVLRLMNFLLSLQEDGMESIVLGMGDHGMISRVFGGVFGNAYTFLTTHADKISGTAKGQLSIEDFEDISMILKRIQNGG